MTQRLTPDEATELMEGFARSNDTEGAHWDADELLLRIAQDAGFSGAVEAYSDIAKWYS